MFSKETVDDAVVYSGLYEDGGYTWNLLIRSGGSVSLYATRPGEAVHHVAYDSLDAQPPTLTARRVLIKLADMAEGINALLAAVQAQEASAQVGSAL